MNKHGFTLIEVIISALILSMTVGGILFVFSTEKGVVSHSGRRDEAMNFARQTLEELRNEVREDTWDTGNLRIHQTPWNSLSGDFGTKFSGQRKYEVTAGPALDAYRAVTVTVDWTEP